MFQPTTMGENWGTHFHFKYVSVRPFHSGRMNGDNKNTHEKV